MWSRTHLLPGLLLMGLHVSPAGAQSGPTQAELNAAHSNSADWLLTNHDYRGQRDVDLTQISGSTA